MSTERSVFKEFLVRKRQVNDIIYLSIYLSALTLDIISGADAIILNSVVNVNKAVLYIKSYTTINCYLDNDNAGQIALVELTAKYGSTVINRSALYSEFNDLNDFLVNRSFTTNTLPNENK